MDGPGQAGWDAIVSASERALIALDYDGVLAPIVADPDQAVPAPGAIESLRRLAGQVGTLAVVTGRPAEVVVRLGGLDSVPGLLVEGLDGRRLTPHEAVVLARLLEGLHIKLRHAAPAQHVDRQRLFEPAAGSAVPRLALR